jgi:protein tyrosine/serine phosphatase
MEKLKSKNYKNPTNYSEDHNSNKTRILNFYKLKDTNSKISCHGKPNFKEIKNMKLTYGVNHILTLLKPKEKPEEIKECCEKNNINWSIIYLDGANLGYFRQKSTQEAIVNGILNIYEILVKNPVVLFIHCAAGLHRTGTILYSLFRIFDETPESSLDALKYVREETWKKVGEERIKVAETVIVPLLINKLKPKINLEITQVVESNDKDTDQGIEKKINKK